MSCIVCGISAHSAEARQEELSFHRFPSPKTPSERRRREKWANFCHLTSEAVPERACLCSRHFLPEERSDTGYLRKLARHAIPTQSGPPPKDDELPVADQVDNMESNLSGNVQQMETQEGDDATLCSALAEDAVDDVEELKVPSELAGLLCRMCGRQEDNMLSVHSPSLPDDELSIADKMRMHLSVEVSSEDSLPQSICHCCCEALNSWHETFVSSLAADKVLRECFTVEDGAAKIEATDSQQVPSEPTESSKSRFTTTKGVREEEQPAVVSLKDVATNTEPEEGTESDLKFLLNPLSPKTSQYLCVYCRVIFRDREELKVHRVQCSQLCFLCEKCGKDFPTRTRSKLHLHSHAENQSLSLLSCEQCGKRFRTNRKLQIHMSRHRGYVCEICSQVFDKPHGLLSHQLTHSILPKFFCEPCCRIFPNGTALKQHELEHKPAQENPLIDRVCHTSCSGGQTTYSCKVCGVAFESKLLLISHLNSPAPSSCPQCGKELRTEKQYFVHTRTCQSLQCRFCAKVLKSAVNLRDHENRHVDNRSHKCQFCDRSFCTLPQKRNHERKHVGPTFSCEICGRSFFHNFVLKEHLLKHEGVKFPCDVCQKDFASKTNVYKHKRKCHRDMSRRLCVVSGNEWPL